MSEIYTIIIVILAILAVSGLFVGCLLYTSYLVAHACGHIFCKAFGIDGVHGTEVGDVLQQHGGLYLSLIHIWYMG